jgi:hypothetical protein
MGMNHPANNVDPTGGVLPGIGCAATAGMSGYGGMAERIAGCFNIGSVLGTISFPSRCPLRLVA